MRHPLEQAALDYLRGAVHYVLLCDEKEYRDFVKYGIWSSGIIALCGAETTHRRYVLVQSYPLREVPNACPDCLATRPGWTK